MADDSRVRRGKRGREEDTGATRKHKRRHGSMKSEPEEMDEEHEKPFEDDAEDEFESEDEVHDLGSVCMDTDAETDVDSVAGGFQSGEEHDLKSDEEVVGPREGRARAGEVWHPGAGMEPGEELDFDPNAYKTFHAFDVDWSCLSFDIVRDHLGYQRKKLPYTMYAVTGTQAEDASDNKVHVVKLSNLCRTNEGAESEEEDDDDDDEEDDNPIFEHCAFKHQGGVNRIRTLPQQPNIVATWADTGSVHIWDTMAHLKSLDMPGSRPDRVIDPLATFSGHAAEGFAMDWSTITSGRLITGDCSRYIHLWEKAPDGWRVGGNQYSGHMSSVEDLQWSPTQADVFASCSSDQTVRIWDLRDKSGSQVTIHAHECDVNVIAWNRFEAYLLVSGGDDGSFNIWDLRYVTADGSSEPPQHFKFHTGAITSLEWHPTEASCLAVSGADDQITLWDMAVEADETGMATEGVEYPPQLLFPHRGQKEMKEVHWHPQIPGLVMSTAHEGFHVFQPVGF